MATENRVLDVTYEAAEDLSADQYRFVVLASGKVRRPDVGTEKPFGILQNAPVAGEAAVVRFFGISKIRLGGTVAALDWIKLEYVSATDAGNGLTAVQSTEAAGVMTFGDLTNCLCLAGGADGELGEALIVGVPQRL